MFFALVSSAARLVQLITSGIFGQLWVSTFYVLILTGTMVFWNTCTLFARIDAYLNDDEK